MRLLKINSVLAATDLDSSSDAALETAARLAHAAGAKLHIAYVSADRSDAGHPGAADPKAELAEALRRVRLSGESHRLHVLTGTPEVALSQLSAEVVSDVTVLGRHRGRTDMPEHSGIGNTAHAIVARSLSPSLVTSRPLTLPIQRVVVAVDASESARGALLVALSWASALRGSAASGEPTLTALHVETGGRSSPDQAHLKRTIKHELDILRRSAGSWAGVTVEGVAETDADPVKAITRFATARDADLIVLGTRGLSPDKAARLGSVSAAVTRQLDAPVLLVPPAVWRSHARDIDYF